MNIKKVISNVFIILGALIGGGLATGKELATFFCCFGSNFWIPCLISVITFIFIILVISKLNFTNANKKTEFAFFCFRIIIASTMLSALKEICGYLPYFKFSYAFLLILTFALMFVSYAGVSKIFNIFIPIVFIGLILISILSIKQGGYRPIFQPINITTIMNGLIYSALNLFLLFYIVKKALTSNTKKEKILTIVFSTTLFASILLIFSFAIIKSNTLNNAVPLLDMAIGINQGLLIPAIICIILAIISTYIGIAFDLKNYLQTRTTRNLFLINSILFSISMLISNFGLDNLINYGYKGLGIFALCYFIFLFIKQKITRNKASEI